MQRNRKIRRLTWLSGSIVLFFLLALYAYRCGYRINTSTSYPSGLYRLTDHSQNVRVGELVLFCPPNSPVLQTALERGYIGLGRCKGGFEPVIKKVAAVGGARIGLQNSITINGAAVPHALVLANDGKGRPLPQLADFTVPDGKVFLLSDHKPRVSFDSRYYGSVPLANVQGHITPVWTN